MYDVFFPDSTRNFKSCLAVVFGSCAGNVRAVIEEALAGEAVGTPVMHLSVIQVQCWNWLNNGVRGAVAGRQAKVGPQKQKSQGKLNLNVVY